MIQEKWKLHLHYKNTSSQKKAYRCFYLINLCTLVYTNYMNMTPTLRETIELINQVSGEIKEIAESITQVSMLAKKDRLLECAEELKSAETKIQQSIDFMYFGQKSGGQRSTMRKTRAVQENGKKGGRPSKKIVMAVTFEESKSSCRVTFDDGSHKNVKGGIQEAAKAFPQSRYKWDEKALLDLNR